MPDDRSDVVRTAHLAARVGRLLLEYGADTAHASRRIDEVAALSGYPLRRLVTAEGVIVGAGEGAIANARIGRSITAMGVDMGRIVAVERAIDGLRDGSRDLATIDRRLDGIEGSASGYPAAVVILGVGATAASLARLFAADWPMVAVALVAGVVGTALRLTFARRHLNPFAATILGALLSGITAGLAVRVIPGRSSIICLTAAGMILVPGVPLINGVRDLVEGHAGNAVARLTFGTAMVLAIGFALLLAAAVTGGTLPIDAAPGSLPVAQDLLVSAIAAAGYATLFNVPVRAVPACILCGMASHGLRTALGHAGIDIATGSLIGALAAGVIARMAGRLHRVPAVTFAFPGIVAMIPGSYGFRAAVGGLHLMTLGAAAPAAVVAGTLSLIVTTAIVTIAIAIGLTLALAIPSEFPIPPKE